MTTIKNCFRHECKHCKGWKELPNKDERDWGECELEEVIMCRDGQCVQFLPKEENSCGWCKYLGRDYIGEYSCRFRGIIRGNCMEKTCDFFEKR